MKTNNIPIKQSGIRAATIRCEKLGGVNLGQGVCDLPVIDSIKQAAIEAILNNKNTYSAYEGVYELREKVANKLLSFNKIKTNNINEIMISHGSTAAFVCAIKALTNSGDEVILLEPFYGYHKQILDINHITVKTVKISLADLSLDMEAIERQINSKTKAIVLCNPANPSGKVFSREELIQIGSLALKHKITIITDEIYEYITYPGHEHVSLASLEGFKDCTIMISGLSKTYNMTGWRLGYVSAPEEIIRKMALIHDAYYICPPTPLQYAAISAINLPDEYYVNLRESYFIKRNITLQYLKNMGFEATEPQGSYYIMVNFAKHPLFSGLDDEQIAQLFLEKAKVAVVTGRSFYSEAASGNRSFRICYALNQDTVIKGLEQMMGVCHSSAIVSI